MQYFGINDISDLPRPKEVEELLAEGEGGALLQEIPDDLLLPTPAEQGEEQKQEAKSGSQQATGEKEPKTKGAGALQDAEQAVQALSQAPESGDSAGQTDASDQTNEMKEAANNAAQ